MKVFDSRCTSGYIVEVGFRLARFDESVGHGSEIDSDNSERVAMVGVVRVRENVARSAVVLTGEEEQVFKSE